MGRKSGLGKSWTFDNIEALDMNLWGHRSASADLISQLVLQLLLKEGSLCQGVAGG